MIEEHDGETEGYCQGCGLLLTVYNRRRVTNDPYHLDVHNDPDVFFDGCEYCHQQTSDDI